MVFANIPVKGWVINSYEQNLFNCSIEVLVLTSNYAEVLDVTFLFCDVAVVVNERGGFLMFF